MDAERRRVYWSAEAVAREEDASAQRDLLVTVNQSSEERVVRWTRPSDLSPPASPELPEDRGNMQGRIVLPGPMFNQTSPGFLDSHCHLDLLFKRDGGAKTLAEYMQRTQAAFPEEFRGCVTVFCDPFTWSHTSTWMHVLEDRRVWGTMGCHPHHALKWDCYKEEQLVDALKSHPKLVALGEIGLDFSRNNHVHGEIQRMVFERQLRIAVEGNKPIVLHLREAEREGLEMVKREVPRSHPVHWHCVTGNWPVVHEFMESFPNSVFGFTPLICNRQACNARAVAQQLPLDRIVVESDAPYFLPQKYREMELRWAHPGMAIEVVKTLSQLHDASETDVCARTYNNANKLYGLGV